MESCGSNGSSVFDVNVGGNGSLEMGVDLAFICALACGLAGGGGLLDVDGSALER